MTAAHFEDHPTDPDKMIMRKPSMKVEGPVHVVCQCDKCKAQPEQEPVAEVTSETGAEITMSWWHEPALPIGTKLYTTPPQRKPLTDEEIWKFWWNKPEVSEGEDDSMEAQFVAACRRAIEAAHGIKGEA
jgi:hypothetical protein